MLEESLLRRGFLFLVMEENTMFDLSPNVDLLPATNHHKEREQRLFDYLVTELDSNILINIASHYWISLKMKVWDNSKQILEVPDCCPSNDDSRVMFTWDKDEHYLECEIIIDGTKEFFYRNRITKEAMGEDYFPSANISEDILKKLQLFVE